MFLKSKNYFELSIQWRKTDNASYPYEASINNHALRIRLNDFPDEVMYTLLVDDKIFSDFDNWPEKWTR